MSIFSRPSDAIFHEATAEVAAPVIDVIEPNVALSNEAADRLGSENGGHHPVQWAKRNWRKLAFGGALGLAVAGGAYVTENGVPDLKNVDITEVGRTLIDATEEAAPYLLGAAGLQIASMAFTRGGKQKLNMAYLGLGRYPEKRHQRLMAGALLPTIGVTCLSTALMIEDGIHTGANKNISSMVTSLEEEYPGKEIAWTLQSGSNHFMNDSDISPEVVQNISATEQVTNGTFLTAPFYRDLVTIPTPYSENQAGMIISVSGASPILPEVKDGTICEQPTEPNQCDLKANEIILDADEGFEIGDSVEIRGHDFTVVGFPEEDQSLVNRLIAFTGVSEETIGDKDPYGFASLVENKEDALKMIEDLGLQDQVDILSTEQFLENNENFWSHNGTPLLILLIGDIAIFAGVTFSSMKKFEQERDRPVLATLRAIGTSSGQIAQQQYARTTIQTAKGVIPGFAAAEVSTLAINQLLPGFSGDVTPKMVMASTALALGVQMASATKGVLAGRRTGLAEQMKSK